jgi:hypothetical protein
MGCWKCDLENGVWILKTAFPNLQPDGSYLQPPLLNKLHLRNPRKISDRKTSEEMTIRSLKPASKRYNGKAMMQPVYCQQVRLAFPVVCWSWLFSELLWPCAKRKG